MGPMLLRHTRYYNIGRSYVISKEHLLACLLTGVATLPQSVPCGGTGGGHVETLAFFTASAGISRPPAVDHACVRLPGIICVVR